MKNEMKKKTLSEAEQRRSDHFEKIAEELEQQGYKRKNMTIKIGKANGFAVLLLILLLIIGYGLYFLIWRTIDFAGFNPLIFFVTLLVLVVVHELIHGFCWSLFTPHHFKDIEFGIMKPSMTPYCTCLVPLKKNHYIFGTVMPFIVLGIIPIITGLAIRNSAVLFLGIIMASSAAGDLMIIRNVAGYKSDAKEIIYMDHPTEAGGVVFER